MSKLISDEEIQSLYNGRQTDKDDWMKLAVKLEDRLKSAEDALREIQLYWNDPQLHERTHKRVNEHFYRVRRLK